MLQIYNYQQLVGVLAKPYRAQAFYHQTTNFESVFNVGWDVTERSNARRFFGDGIYFSAPKPFWPKYIGNTIEVRLRLDAYHSFLSTNEFAQHVLTWNLNNQSDHDQTAIRKAFLSKGITCASFPEEIGDDAEFNALMGTPNRTYVVYDPEIIFITSV